MNSGKPQKEPFTNSFVILCPDEKDAETVYWLPTYLSRENLDLAILSPDDLSKHVSNVIVTDLDDTLWQTINEARAQGKMVLCMGAGTVDGWIRAHL